MKTLGDQTASSVPSPSAPGRPEGLAAAWRARLVAALAVPCILGLTLWQVWSSRQDALGDAEALSLALSRVAEEHFIGMLRTIDSVLVEAEDPSRPGGMVDSRVFRDLMSSRMKQFPFIRRAFVVSGAGRVLSGSNPEDAAGIDVHDREYFASLAADPSLNIFISVPLVSRARPETLMFISRAIRDAKGALRGAAVIAIDPKLFEDELRTVQPPHGGFATLLRQDGAVLSRVPDGAKWVGKIVGGGPAMQASATQPRGVILGRGAIDGTDRLLAFSRLDPYPLVVVVGTRLDGALAEWRSNSMVHAGVGLVLSVLVLIMASRSDRSLAERLRIQQALAASESRYRLLIDRSPLGIIQARANGEAVYANGRWLDLVGCGSDEVLGRKWCDFVVAEDRPLVLERWSAMIRDGGAFSSEMRIGGPGGLRWVRGHASPIDPSVGEAGLVATFEDITAGKEIEQTLRLSEEKFAKAFLGSPDALVISARDTGRYVDLNTAFCRLLGYERDEFLAGDAFSLGVWADPADRVRLVDLVTRDGQVEDFETRLRRKDRAVLVVQISVQSITVAGLPCMLFICRDITERRAMEDRTRSLVAKLDASNKELEQFAYVASHDLQEPLRMIAGYAQLLERRYRGRLDADADEFIDFLVDGAKRMQVMIRDLLEYSRVERLGGAFERFDGAAALEEVRRNLRAAVEEAGGRVEIGPMPEIVADRSQFVRLLQNLIGNAVKYRHQDRPPEITVSAEAVDGHWEFSVADNGIGIDAQYFDRIFQVFQRLHTRDKFEGTGIGLAICKKIVERHGGRLWVESRPDQGSVFRFTLWAHSQPVDTSAGL